MAGPEVGVASAACKAVLSSKSIYHLLFNWKYDTSVLSDLETQVNSMKAMLNVAEARQINEEPFVDEWIKTTRYVIYDAEDLLDQIFTDIHNVEYRLGNSPGIKDKIVQKLKYKGKDVVRTIHPSKKTREAEMREIIQRLQFVADQATHLGLDKKDELTSFRENRISTSSDNDSSKIIGRSKDEIEILRLLNSREGNDDGLRVIPIIGMGGVGKTTLTSIVYNGYKISEQSDQVFQVKGWVCVSDKFKVTDVIKSLLESITGNDSKTSNNSEYLQSELKGALQDKRFLLILDDIWSDIEAKWETLQTIFSVGAPGSRIIVTTREENVARIVNPSTSPYRLNELSDDESWSLFQRYAFQNGSSSAYPNLEITGKKIVDKCKGLPLAIKMLGRLLLSKENDEKEWNSVLHSKIWNSTNNILPSLWLSYYHLPLPIRQCFGYFSIFPKNYAFSMDEMVRFWVAESFVHMTRESSSDYEHVAHTYFKHLCSVFFFQPSGNCESKFVMHDLVHDLAEYVSKDSMVDLTNINFGSRRLPCIRDQQVLLTTKSIRKLSQLRTFLPISGSTSHWLFNNKVCNDLLSNFKLLRVLSLEGHYDISVLPDSIGDMKLLRYLNLSRTNIEYLPPWIGRLYNLQTLDLSYCGRIKSLPTNVCELVNLRHLIAKKVDFEGIPNGTGKMTSIQTFPAFVIYEGKSKQMREFRELINLRGSLQISGLNNVDDLQDVITANFCNKENLEELVLKWDDIAHRDTTLDARVLDAMQSHRNLKRLTIKRYGGKKLPKWIVGESPSFTYMVSLQIVYCFNCEALPSLGHLPYLENLSIKGLDCMESLGEEFYGDTENSFPTLQTFEVCYMKALKKWCFPKGSGFSSLKDLVIDVCPELSEIPYCFPHLTTLKISSCDNLVRLEMCNAENGSTLTTCGNSLEHITIDSCAKLEEIPKSFFNLVRADIGDCDSLVSVPRLLHMHTLKLRNVGTLLSIDALLQNCPAATLEELAIDNVCSVSKLLSRFISLKHLNLRINDNDDQKTKGSEDDNDSMIRLPPNLLNLWLSGGINSNIMSNIGNLNSLTRLSIRGCHDLESFPYVELPHTLMSLEIHDCHALKSIPDSFLCRCNQSLVYLWIGYCPNLACLPDSISALQSLHKLILINCPLIQHFPTSNSPHYLISLSNLELQRMPALKSLPDGFHNITSLESLGIYNCSNLVIPQDGFPAKLRSLNITNCGNLRPISEMKLSNLMSLQKLFLRGFSETSTLDHCLPESIEELMLLDFPDLKSLSGVLPSLKQLKSLHVVNCPLVTQKGGSKKLKQKYPDIMMHC